MLTATDAADIASRKLRERLAAALAVIIVLGFVVMMFVAFFFIGSGATDPAFDRVKDLLLFVNPLVGVVLGYYFNKVSTDARAENAERTAQAASSSLQTSQSTLQQTQTQLQTAQQTADEAKTTLGQLIDPVQQTLQQMSPSQGATPEAFGSDSRGDLAPIPVAPTLDPQTRLNLEMALARAKRLVGTP
jgi:ABC-type transporter Mla subunit MlaD